MKLEGPRSVPGQLRGVEPTIYYEEKKGSSSAKSERQPHDLKSPPTHQVLCIEVYSIFKFDYHIDLPLLGLRAKTYAKKVVGGRPCVFFKTQQAVMLQQCWGGGGCGNLNA